MDVLERLHHLIDERGWSVYRVAHTAGLSGKRCTIFIRAILGHGYDP